MTSIGNVLTLIVKINVNSYIIYVKYACTCIDYNIRTYRIRQNFRGGKLLRLCTKHTIHWKTFVVHQAHTIMYCTQQMIQEENYCDWLKTAKTAKVFPLESFAVYGM